MAVDLSFDTLAPNYRHLWETCTLLPSRKSAADYTASKILANKDRYLTVEQATTVPWTFIGLVHAMEGGLNFSTHLHNGDTLSKRTTHVPRGRPKNGNPPFSWEESAIDAVTFEGLDKVREWPLERFLFELEAYNGWGYVKLHPPINTPYLWSGTNQYVRGKYVADGKYDPNAVSGQSGAVAILKCAMARDTAVAALFSEPEHSPVVAAALAATMDAVHEPPTITPATASDLVPLSSKMAILVKLRTWLFGGSLGTGAVTVDSLMQPDGPANNFMTIIQQHPVWVLGVAFLFLIGAGITACILINYILKDYNQGRYLPSKGATD